MRRFEALLSKPKLTRAEAGNRAFDCLFCRPLAGALRARWDCIRAERPLSAGADRSIAQGLLLSYRPDFGGSLWLLEAKPATTLSAELSPLARRALERAMLLVTRELPALVDVPRAADTWSIARLATQGEHVLDGESFGLSMCLVAASRALALPFPSNLAATAVVDTDGTLYEVSGLDEKLRVLHDWALGVDTVLVAASQAESARAASEKLGATWSVVGARSLTDAMSSAFPHLWSDLESRWADPLALEHVAADLLRLARDGSNHVLGWRGISEAADRVAARLPPETISYKNARFAALVARRHDTGEGLIELDPEHLGSMRRPLRLRCLAHVLQSHADCAEALVPELESAAIACLPADAREDSPDDLWLIGALGRALAAFFRYDEAERFLRRAVEGWFELDAVPNASHAVSELLRVLALTNQATLFEHAVHTYGDPLVRDPRVASVSRGFVLYSVGRGHALLDNASAASDRLSSGAHDWDLLPHHVRALRLRWLIRATRAQRHGEGVEELMAELGRLVRRTPDVEFSLALAELDQAIHAGQPTGVAMRRFAALRPIDYTRFRTAYGARAPEHIAREFRY